MSANLKNIFTQTKAILVDDRERGIASFEVHSREDGGLRNTVVARDFTFDIDEPEALGGADGAPNPVEVALGSLAACQAITYRLYAASLGIRIDRLAIRARGRLDLRGLFGVDASVRPGTQRVELEVTVDTPASDAQLARLKALVDRNCPILDTIRHPVPVRLSLARGGPAPADSTARRS